MATPAKRRHPRATSNVKAACQGCRASKTKCDGVRPSCSRCTHRSTPCTYDTEPDEFRITALKRKYAEVQKESSSRERLLRLLLEGTHEGSVAILRRMRSRESDDEILTELDGSNAPLQDLMEVEEGQSGTTNNVDLERASSPPQHATNNAGPDDRLSIAFLVGRQAEPRTLSEGAESRSTTPRPGHTQRLLGKRRRLSDVLPDVPRPMYQTSISAPTKSSPVSGDIEPLVPKPIATDYSWVDGLERVRAIDWQVPYASDLSLLEMLNCYFTWENPVMGLVQEEAFWDGLKAGGSEFCNVCLVHSMIALGSKIYRISHPDGVPSLDKQALHEAIRLWGSEPRTTTPANISAGLLIHTTFASNGQDEVGAPYLAEAMELVVRSGLFSEVHAARLYSDADPKVARQRADFAWAVYAHHGYHTLTFNSSLFLTDPPCVPIPDVNEPDDRRQWIPFPFISPECPGMSSSKSHSRASLWRLGNRILPLHRKHSSEVPSEVHWNEALELHKELVLWHQNLNTRLNILHATPPHVLWLHTDYHRCVLEIFRPFVAARKNILLRPFEPAYHHTLASNAQLRLLTHQVELQYPRMPIAFSALVGPMLIICNDSLPHALSKGEGSDECFYFCLCLRLMHRMIEAYPLMPFLMRGLQQVAARKGVGLPREVHELIKSVGKGRSPVAVVRSTFPVDLDLMATDLQASQLQRLVDEAGHLSIT